MKIRESVKNSLSEYRNKEKMTQEALAVKAGVTRQTIIAIEKGNYTPSVLLALKLADIFSVNIKDIFYI